jgi:hypothetical protein
LEQDSCGKYVSGVDAFKKISMMSGDHNEQQEFAMAESKQAGAEINPTHAREFLEGGLGGNSFTYRRFPQKTF